MEDLSQEDVSGLRARLHFYLSICSFPDHWRLIGWHAAQAPRPKHSLAVRRRNNVEWQYPSTTPLISWHRLKIGIELGSHFLFSSPNFNRCPVSGPFLIHEIRSVVEGALILAANTPYLPARPVKNSVSCTYLSRTGAAVVLHSLVENEVPRAISRHVLSCLSAIHSLPKFLFLYPIQSLIIRSFFWNISYNICTDTLF